MSNHSVERPLKANSTILKSVMIRVTRNKTIPEESHLKRPNVTRLIGSRRRVITGFATNEATVTAAPARRIVSIPFSKTRPEAIMEVK